MLSRFENLKAGLVWKIAAPCVLLRTFGSFGRLSEWTLDEVFVEWVPSDYKFRKDLLSVKSEFSLANRLLADANATLL